jgi:hypothetical protein
MQNVVENLFAYYMQIDHTCIPTFKECLVREYTKHLQAVEQLRAQLITRTIRILFRPLDGQGQPVLTDEQFNTLKTIKRSDLTEEEQKSKCSICSTEYEEEDIIIALPCSTKNELSHDHYFHKDCIYEWTTKHASSCPLCRCEITVNTQ